jgi:hypothetical protein
MRFLASSAPNDSSSARISCHVFFSVCVFIICSLSLSLANADVATLCRIMAAAKQTQKKRKVISSDDDENGDIKRADVRKSAVNSPAASPLRPPRSLAGSAVVSARAADKKKKKRQPQSDDDDDEDDLDYNASAGESDETSGSDGDQEDGGGDDGDENEENDVSQSAFIAASYKAVADDLIASIKCAHESGGLQFSPHIFKHKIADWLQEATAQSYDDAFSQMKPTPGDRKLNGKVVQPGSYESKLRPLFCVELVERAMGKHPQKGDLEMHSDVLLELASHLASFAGDGTLVRCFDPVIDEEDDEKASGDKDEEEAADADDEKDGEDDEEETAPVKSKKQKTST